MILEQAMRSITIFKGNGGILKYFLGLSAEMFNRISLGVNMNYLHGDITRQRMITFPKNRGFAETHALEEIVIGHTYFGFGLQYKEVFGEKFFFTVGGTYDLETKLNSAFTSSVTNVFPGKGFALNDSVVVNRMWISSIISPTNPLPCLRKSV